MRKDVAIKAYLQEWTATPCSRAGRLSTSTETPHLRLGYTLIYRFSQSLPKAAFKIFYFTENDTFILKFIRRANQSSQNSLEKEEQSQKVPDFQTYHTATASTMWSWHKVTHAESRIKPAHLQPLIFHKVAKKSSVQWEKEVILTIQQQLKVLRPENKVGPYTQVCPHTSSKWLQT